MSFEKGEFMGTVGIDSIQDRYENVNKLIKLDIAKEVSNKMVCSQEMATKFTDAVLESLTEILAGGKSLEIRGFGVFKVKRIGRRIGRNPATGESIPVEEHWGVRFKASKLLTKIINLNLEHVVDKTRAPF
jgi:nucleoid DNA-binding protein